MRLTDEKCRYGPNSKTTNQSETREITPYVWVHADDDR